MNEKDLGIIVAITIVIISMIIAFTFINQFLIEKENCALWIGMNEGLSDPEFHDRPIFEFESNEEFFKDRFHANFYKCDRLYDYETVHKQLENGVNADEIIRDWWD